MFAEADSCPNALAIRSPIQHNRAAPISSLSVKLNHCSFGIAFHFQNICSPARICVAVNSLCHLSVSSMNVATSHGFSPE